MVAVAPMVIEVAVQKGENIVHGSITGLPNVNCKSHVRYFQE